MSEQHTPGPWYQGTQLTQIEGIAGTIVCHVSGAESIASVIADARLIAAAPELLWALQEVVASQDESCPAGSIEAQERWATRRTEALNAARAAIAKATKKPEA